MNAPEGITFENRVRQYFGFLLTEFGFKLERVQQNPLEEDGLALLSSPVCRLQISEHHGDGEIEWAQAAQPETWYKAFALHHFLWHELGLSGSPTPPPGPDWMAAQAEVVRTIFKAVLAYFQADGYDRRRGKYEFYTAERRAAYRRDREARRGGTQA
jgi:hypothetical protein